MRQYIIFEKVSAYQCWGRATFFLFAPPRRAPLLKSLGHRTTAPLFQLKYSRHCISAIAAPRHWILAPPRHILGNNVCAISKLGQGAVFLIILAYNFLQNIQCLSLVSGLLFHFYCLMSLVSFLSFPVSCFLSLVSCLLSHVSRLLSHISCFLSLVSCLLFPASCLTSPASRLLSTFPVSRLLSQVSCLTSPVSHLLFHSSCLPSPV